MKIYNLLFLILSSIKKSFYTLKYKRFMTVGKKVQIDYNSRITIKNNSKITIDDNVYLRSKKRNCHSALYFSSTLFADGNNAVIKIGANSNLSGCYIHSQKEIIVGKNCLISTGVNILDSNGHEVLSNNRRLERDIPERIHIEDNVWIGINAVILKNTVIGKNSVVGANSVVRGKFPPNSVIMGNPAVIVTKLNL